MAEVFKYKGIRILRISGLIILELRERNVTAGRGRGAYTVSLMIDYSRILHGNLTSVNYRYLIVHNQSNYW